MQYRTASNSLKSTGRFRIGLQNLLFCFFTTVSIVPVLFLGGWVQQNSLKSEIEAVEDKHLLLAKNLNGALSRYAIDLKAVFTEKAKHDVDEFSVETQALFDSFNIRMFARLEGGRRMYRLGDVSFWPRDGLTALTQQQRQAETNPEMVIVSPIVFAQNDQPMIYLLRGETDGSLVIGAVSTEYFIEVQKAITFGELGHAAIVDQTGQAFAHPNPDWQATAKDMSKIEPVQRMMAGQTGVVQFYSPALKADMVAGYSFVPETGWGAMIPQPYVELENSANETRKIAFLISLSGLVFAIFISWQLSRYVVSPIQAVIQASGQIASGIEIETLSLPGKLIPKEMNALLASFNHMAMAVTRSQRQLEARVEERTQALKIAKEKADSASVAKSEFLSNMSHELRTPLNGILGHAHILELSSSLNEEGLHSVNIIRQCGLHLLTLINDILDLSKIEARKLELMPSQLELPSLLDSVVAMCKIKADQKNIELIYQPSTRLPRVVKADEKRLRQVLINLLNNAVKFTDRGAVTLRIDVLNQLDDKVTLSFQIIDTGIGIAATDIGYLFEDFKQVGDRHRQAEGTGLGLAISQRIVQLMGGKIQVASQPAVGSEFFFTLDLPLIKDLESSQEQQLYQSIMGYQRRVPLADREQPYCILVIDDRWENRTVLSNLLTTLGFTVIEAQNGQEGLEKLQDTRPDLVITDLVMPMMNGVELLNHIRGTDRLKPLKVIVSSASVAMGQHQVAVETMADAFLAKPVDIHELFKILPELLDLDWIMETPVSNLEGIDSTELNLPTTSVLEELLSLAQCGQVQALRERLSQLASQDQSYQPFVEIIASLARQFRVEEIESRLQQYLSKGLIHAE